MDTATAPEALTETTDNEPAATTTETKKRRAPRRPTADDLDRAILMMVLRFSMLQPPTLYELLGGSPHTIRNHIEYLVAKGMLEQEVVPATLRDSMSATTTRRTWTTVLKITGKGRRYVQDWYAVGYPEGTLINLNVTDRSDLEANHMLGVGRLAAWYRRSGFQICSEREIRSLEMRMPTNEDGGPRGERKYPQPDGYHWCVSIPGNVGAHPPDLGVIDPDGYKWAVELERSTKRTVADYHKIIKAYRDAGLGQVWHVLTVAAKDRLVEAADSLGLGLDGDQALGVVLNEEGTFRVQMWLPGPSLNGVNTKDWCTGERVEVATKTPEDPTMPAPKNPTRIVIKNRRPAFILPFPPAGITAGTPVSDEELKAEWKNGRVVNLVTEPVVEDLPGWW